MLRDYRTHPEYLAAVERLNQPCDLDDKDVRILEDHAKLLLDSRIANRDQLTARAQATTQGSGVIGFLAVLATRSRDNAIEQPAAWCLLGAVGLVVAAAVCGLASMWPRKVPAEAEVESLRDSLVKHGRDLVLRQRYYALATHAEANAIVVQQKAWWLKASYVFLTASLVSLFAFLYFHLL
jgi:hypothetical protein